MKYKAKIHFKSGYVCEFDVGGSFDKEDLACIFSEDILEGFYPRENNEVEFGTPFNKQITGIEFYLNGIKRKEAPAIWENGIGYVFSEKGLERMEFPDKNTKLPDVYTDSSDCRKLDAFCARLTKEEIDKMVHGKTYITDLRTGKTRIEDDNGNLESRTLNENQNNSWWRNFLGPFPYRTYCSLATMAMGLGLVGYGLGLGIKEEPIAILPTLAGTLITSLSLGAFIWRKEEDF